MVIAGAIGLSFLCGGCAATQKMTRQIVGWVPWSRVDVETGSGSEKTVVAHKLTLRLRLSPFPVKLSETRRVEASIRLENASARFVPLEFPTTERFDVILRNDRGKLLAQWSEDQPIDAVPGHVGINPGEHVEYSALLPTRDLQPGRRYSVTVFFPSQKGLTVELFFVPEP